MARDAVWGRRFRDSATTTHFTIPPHHPHHHKRLELYVRQKNVHRRSKKSKKKKRAAGDAEHYLFPVPHTHSPIANRLVMWWGYSLFSLRRARPRSQNSHLAASVLGKGAVPRCVRNNKKVGPSLSWVGDRATINSTRSGLVFLPTICDITHYHLSSLLLLLYVRYVFLVDTELRSYVYTWYSLQYIDGYDIIRHNEWFLYYFRKVWYEYIRTTHE